MAPTGLADRWKAKTLGRSAGGNQSARRELCVGSFTALPIADPERANARKIIPVANPVENEKSDHAKAPTIASRTLE